jgi:hypothetical protein
MTLCPQLQIVIPDGVGLRAELSLRSTRLVAMRGFLHDRTDGSVPSILFGRDERGLHGNFHAEAYQRICASEAWSRRLAKVHTAYKKRRARANWEWKELDCSNSSDALLMNIFCYPGVITRPEVSRLLNTEPGADPEFGYKPRIPLSNGKRDNTEIDMRLGDLLVEAKLTESDFQWASPRLLARYRDLDTVFNLEELTLRNEKYSGYQLIRGTLAAHALGQSFCVFCDARRPDLIEQWFRVLRAVRPAVLRCRLKLLTWQELAVALPAELQEFLEGKYGISAAG